MKALLLLGMLLQTRVHPSQIRAPGSMIRIYVGDLPDGGTRLLAWAQLKPLWVMDAGRPCKTEWIGIESEGLARQNIGLWTCLTDIGIEYQKAGDPEFAAWYAATLNQ